MKFSVVTGNPTPEELHILEKVLQKHKEVILGPVIKRSAFALPKLRQLLPHQRTFGSKKIN